MQPDGSYLVSSHAAIDRIYRDTGVFSSDKKKLFEPKFGLSPLYEHHTSSLVFNDPPLHTRVRKIIVGAMTPKAIAGMESGLKVLVDSLLDDLVEHAREGEIDIVEHFAAKIPLEVIGNLFAMPQEDRGPLRDWSLAILAALEPSVSAENLLKGNRAVLEFKAYLAELAQSRRLNPGNPKTDVLTRLLQSEHGELTEDELLQNCIFILNAGHETTTNFIANALACLFDYPQERARLLVTPELINSAVDEILRFESPNQIGNRLTQSVVNIQGVRIAENTNLHLLMGAANRDTELFDNPHQLDLSRKPNKHVAFAGGPHACLGLNLAKMEGRIAISRFIERFPYYCVTSRKRSPRMRFRGFVQLKVKLL